MAVEVERRPDGKATMGRAIGLLKKRYKKEMETSLHFQTPWQLLVATILSAQSQDSQVNVVTEGLFKRYPKVDDYCAIRPSQLYRHIGSLGLYRNKARNIVNAARMLEKRFGSVVPDTMEQLIQLPGVGRKTANVVLYNAFGKTEGIAIDTHCITVANRLLLIKSKNPEKIEKRFMAITPKNEWGNVTHLFIALGRDTCTARRKFCGRCALRGICPSSDA